MTGSQHPNPSSQHPTLAPNTLPPHPDILQPHSLHYMYPHPVPPFPGAPHSLTPPGELGLGGRRRQHPGPTWVPSRSGPCVSGRARGDLARSGPVWLKIKEGSWWLPRLPVNQLDQQLGGCLGPPGGAGWVQAPGAGCGPPAPSSPTSHSAPMQEDQPPWAGTLWEVGWGTLATQLPPLYYPCGDKGQSAAQAPCPCLSDPTVVWGRPKWCDPQQGPSHHISLLPGMG